MAIIATVMPSTYAPPTRMANCSIAATSSSCSWVVMLPPWFEFSRTIRRRTDVGHVVVHGRFVQFCMDGRPTEEEGWGDERDVRALWRGASRWRPLLSRLRPPVVAG